MREHAKNLIFKEAPTVTLRGPGQIYTRRPEGQSVRMGWDGLIEWEGWKGYQYFVGR